MAKPMEEATKAMQEVGSAGATDPSNAIVVWDKLVEGFATIATSVSNDTVKPLATKVHTDVSAVRDALKKMLVDKDATAMSAMTQASAAMQKSFTDLIKACPK